MRSLYDSIETYSSKLPTISAEMIAPQVGDYIVTEMNNIHQEILEIVAACYKDGKDASYNVIKIPKVSELVDRLDQLLLDRFGIQFETTHTSYTLAATIPVVPKKWNTLNDFSLDLGDLETSLNKLKGKSSDSLSAGNQILKEAQDAQKALDKALETKSIVFDLNKAVVRGLPKEYKVQIIVNYMEAVTLGITPQELTAIILHEVGHAWTHLEYSYRNTRNTSVLLDTFMDNYRNKNKTPKESLILAYTEATGDTSAKNLKDVKGPAVYITLARNYLGHCNKYLTGGFHSYTDSENLADGFAARFGLGADIAQGLMKAHDKYKPYRYIGVFILSSTVILYILAAIGCLIFFGPFGIVNGVILMLTGITLIYPLYRMMFPGERVTETMTYDTVIKRFERVKNQTVKTLRESNLKKEALQSLLDSIESLERTIKAAYKRHNEWSGPIEAMIRLFNGDKVEIKRLEQITENLMENNLHVAAAKVKLLQS